MTAYAPVVFVAVAAHRPACVAKRFPCAAKSCPISKGRAVSQLAAAFLNVAQHLPHLSANPASLIDTRACSICFHNNDPSCSSRKTTTLLALIYEASSVAAIPCGIQRTSLAFQLYPTTRAPFSSAFLFFPNTSRTHLRLRPDFCRSMDRAQERLRGQQPSGTSAALHYKPLDAERQEIRVLDVAPGSGDSMVEATTRPISLLVEPTPAYETISYCWGPPRDPASMKINGEIVEVPASAEEATRQMRYSDKSRVLWIDAICINQESTTERNQQVALMSQVYSLGERNLVYLGEDTDGLAERAFECINHCRGDENWDG